MNYETARTGIKSGDLLAWSHRSWKTLYDIKIQLVRLFTQSEYSHVGIAFAFGDRLWVLESVVPVVRIVPLSNLLPCYVIPMNTNWTVAAETFALSLVGKGAYSQWEAVKAFFGKNTADANWECAEYAMEVLKHCGIAFNCKATPSAVVQAALERGSALTFLTKR